MSEERRANRREKAISEVGICKTIKIYKKKRDERVYGLDDNHNLNSKKKKKPGLGMPSVCHHPHPISIRFLSYPILSSISRFHTLSLVA